MVTEGLTERIGELQHLVSEIDSTRAWQLAMKLIGEQIDLLNENWQAVDAEKFKEMQVTKIGLLSVLDLVNDWKEELAQCLEQLEAEQNPASIQQDDFDNELIEEE